MFCHNGRHGLTVRACVGNIDIGAILNSQNFQRIWHFCQTAPRRCLTIVVHNAGAQPRSQSLGIQFLGLGYCTEQNTGWYTQFRALQSVT